MQQPDTGCKPSTWGERNIPFSLAGQWKCLLFPEQPKQLLWLLVVDHTQHSDWHINSAVPVSRGKKTHKYSNLFVPQETRIHFWRHSWLKTYKTLQNFKMRILHIFFFTLIYSFTCSHPPRWEICSSRKKIFIFLKHVLSSLIDIVLLFHSGKKKDWDSEWGKGRKARCVTKCVCVCEVA